MRLRFGSLGFFCVALFAAPFAGVAGQALGCGGSTSGDVAQVDSGDPLDDGLGSSDGLGDGTDTLASETDPLDSGDGISPGGTSTAVSLVVEPDDGEAKIVDAIKGATKSIHCTMYLFSDNAPRDALIAAKRAGREVQVLLEKAPYPVTNANVADYNTMKAAGVDVRWTNGIFQLTHAKYFVIDAAVAYVMTLNFTSAGLSGNREYAALDSDTDDVAQAEAVFAADFGGVPYKPSGGKLMLSPIDARSRIAALIDAASKSLDIEMEELSDDSVSSHLDAAMAKGVVVRIVVPATGRSDSSTGILLGLKARGAKVFGLDDPAVHAKVLVVDGTRAYVGSVNFTAASFDKNREVGLVTETAAVLARLKTTIDADVAKGAAL